MSRSSGFVTEKMVCRSRVVSTVFLPVCAAAIVNDDEARASEGRFGLDDPSVRSLLLVLLLKILYVGLLIFN